MDIQFPEKLQCLFQPSRYKVLKGGRGGAKSWGVARALLLRGAKQNLQILCVRELQNSIEESVHKLLSQQIDLLGLAGLYVIEKRHIYCPMTGTMFSFEGIARNVNRIRSFEGVDICWVEEAHKVSRGSWRVLIPTIRKEGSEIWITFNPELETDETFMRFVKDPPESAIVVDINWRDNPWFPDVLRAELERDKARDYDEYMHIWEGHCLKNLKGAVYAKELRRAREENRITIVSWERAVPVDTFWDLGRRDMTGIWFAQRVAMQYRVLRYLEDSQEHISHYMKELDRLPYIYGTHHLPHDAKAKTVGAKYSVEQQVRGIGEVKRRVRVVPRTKIFDGISASRMLFDQCWFHEPDCADGLQHLNHYRYDVSESGLFSNEPVHDEHSHCADAFRTMGVAYRPPKEKKPLDLPDPMALLGETMPSLGWMR